MTSAALRRTIAVAARGRSRLSRLRVRYPDRDEYRRYDADLARELLARTGELPGSKRELIALLAEYRKALAARERTSRPCAR